MANPLARIVTLTLLCSLLLGCATESINTAQPIPSASSQSGSFDFYEHSSMIGGKYFPTASGDFSGVLAVDSSQGIATFRGNKLQPLQRLPGSIGGTLYRFWDTVQRCEVSISASLLYRNRDSTLFISSSSINDLSAGTMLVSRRGSWPSVQALMETIPFPPQSFIPLISLWKFVDGNPINNPRREYVASIDYRSNDAFLNGQAATVKWNTTASTGAKVRLMNSSGACDIGPDGDWMFYSSSDPGMAVGGSIGTIGELYMTLRKTLK